MKPATSRGNETHLGDLTDDTVILSARTEFLAHSLDKYTERKICPCCDLELEYEDTDYPREGLVGAYVIHEFRAYQPGFEPDNYYIEGCYACIGRVGARIRELMVEAHATKLIKEIPVADQTVDLRAKALAAIGELEAARKGAA